MSYIIPASSKQIFCKKKYFFIYIFASCYFELSGLNLSRTIFGKITLMFCIAKACQTDFKTKLNHMGK